MPKQLINSILCLLSTLAMVLIFTQYASAVALIRPDGGNSGLASLVDMATEPNNYYAFDKEVITWKMDSEFRQAFNETLQDQVRFAFREWERGSRRAGTNLYSWNRFVFGQTVMDLRTVVMHEIGHALGSQHPDAGWANGDPPYMRNFRPASRGGWTPMAPPGGEIMNEANLGSDGILTGEYWRILSRDELDFIKHNHGSIQFQEVGVDEDADIELSMHNIGGNPGTNLGSSGPDQDTAVLRDINDPAKGKRIIRSTISLNAVPIEPMGIASSATNWEVGNTSGKNLLAINIVTRGTDSPKPINVTSDGPNRFTNYQQLEVSLNPNLEDRIHSYSDPLSGSVPNFGSVAMGLRLDVPDWSVIRALAESTSGDFFDIPLTGFLPWFELGAFEPQEVPPSGGSFGINSLNADIGVFSALALGFQIQLPENTRVTLNELSIASVHGLGLGLEDLDNELLKQLRAEAKLEDLIDQSLYLDADEVPFTVVLQGVESDLPPDLLFSGNYLLLHRPDLVGKELLITATTTSNGDFEVTTQSLLFSPPIEQMPVETKLLPIDIKFCSNPNAFNCTSRGKTPLTLFGTGDFDLATIDVGSLRLCDKTLTHCTGVPISWSTADRGDPTQDLGSMTCAIDHLTGEELNGLNPDGFEDLDVAFDTRDVAEVIGCDGLGTDDLSETLVLIGQMIDGTSITSVPAGDVGIDQLLIKHN